MVLSICLHTAAAADIKNRPITMQQDVSSGSGTRGERCTRHPVGISGGYRTGLIPIKSMYTIPINEKSNRYNFVSQYFAEACEVPGIIFCNESTGMLGDGRQNACDSIYRKLDLSDVRRVSKVRCFLYPDVYRNSDISDVSIYIEYFNAIFNTSMHGVG